MKTHHSDQKHAQLPLRRIAKTCHLLLQRWRREARAQALYFVWDFPAVRSLLHASCEDGFGYRHSQLKRPQPRNMPPRRQAEDCPGALWFGLMPSMTRLSHKTSKWKPSSCLCRERSSGPITREEARTDCVMRNPCVPVVNQGSLFLSSPEVGY